MYHAYMYIYLNKEVLLLIIIIILLGPYFRPLLCMCPSCPRNRGPFIKQIEVSLHWSLLSYLHVSTPHFNHSHFTAVYFMKRTTSWKKCRYQCLLDGEGERTPTGVVIEHFLCPLSEHFDHRFCPKRQVFYLRRGYFYNI